MRRFALLVAASVLVGWGVFGALGGCGGDDDSSAASTPDGATGDEGSSGSSGTSGSSGSSGSSGGDAASTSSSGNPPTSNPGKLTCGATECDAGFGPTSMVCCIREAGAAECSRPQACDDGDLRIQCDEPADCTFGGEGQQCCLRGGARDPRTECRRDCGQNGVRICKTNADCGDAGACNLKKCGAYNLHVCGSPEDCE